MPTVLFCNRTISKALFLLNNQILALLSICHSLMSDNSYMKQVCVFLTFFLMLLALPGNIVAQERKNSQESERVLDTIQYDRNVQNQQTMEVLKDVNEQTSRRADEARKAQKRADAVAAESEKALKMEKKAQKARERADKQAQRAIKASDNY